ncbi:MAG: phage tail tape measure protein [Burkholderiales bacterium]
MSTQNDGVYVKVGAETGGLAPAMNQAAQTVVAASDKMKVGFEDLHSKVGSLKGAFESVAAPIGKLTGLFSALAVVAVGSAFKGMIDESKKLTGEAARLASTLGITTDEASALNTALGDIGADSETYVGAMQHFTRQLKANEDGLQEMGLKTRDANGHLRDSRDLFSEALGITKGYKQGVDQTAAAMTFFGRNTDDAMKLMKLTGPVLEEARQKNEELGLTITKNNVAATKAYKAAVNDLDDVMTAMKKTVGDAVMPVFTEFANWLSTVGPSAVEGLRTVMEGLIATFRMLQGAVMILKAWFVGAFQLMTESAVAFARVMKLVIEGEYAQAWEEAKRGIASYRATALNTWNRMVEEAKEANKKIAAAVTPDASGGAKVGSGGTNTMGDMGGSKAKGRDIKKEQADAISAAQREILAKTQVYETDKVAWEIQNGKFKDFDSQTQRTLMALAQLKDEQARLEAARKSDAEAAAEDYREQEQRKAAIFEADEKQRKALADAAEHWRNVIDPARQYVKQLEQIRELLATGNLTKDEALAAEGDVSDKMADLVPKQQQEHVESFTGAISGAFNRMFNSIRQGTLTMRSLMAGAFDFIGNIAQGVASKIATQWITDLLMTKVMSIKNAFSDISASAARAGAAAFASTAAIPIVGPELAPAAAAASYAGAMSFASGLSVASASKGFDIPAGMNPMTQLHEREMVLPAKYADPLRDQIESGGLGGGGHSLTINAVDARSVERLLVDNPGAVRRALRTSFPSMARRAGVRG